MNVIDAWQGVLEREHAALYGYGIVGGRLGPNGESVREAIKAHTRVRDRCVAILEELGVTPHEPAVAYTTTAPSGAQATRSLAAKIEADCASAYLALIGSDPDSSDATSPESLSKQMGATWLHAATQRQWKWSGDIPAWPGF